MNAELEVAITGSCARLDGDDVLGRLRVGKCAGGALETGDFRKHMLGIKM